MLSVGCCSLFVVICSLLDVGLGSLLCVCCLLFVVCCLLLIGCCLMFVGCGCLLLFVHVSRSLFAVRCSVVVMLLFLLSVGSWFAVCCLLFGAWCLFFVFLYIYVFSRCCSMVLVPCGLRLCLVCCLLLAVVRC